ncbi:protein of unknown function [Bradyrhizobium vignae]|uniref:Uncharacterized protein n=1 Tax=Bradyrhizobium vignae TaxID=1549949 RepID=A0A2U3PTH0_9BRAD|nr:protein of unknown function [Bradyrhizobium vignae]
MMVPPIGLDGESMTGTRRSGATSHSAVLPRESGESGTPRFIDRTTTISDWIARSNGR